MSAVKDTPAGFAPLQTRSPFNRNVGPYFAKAVGDDRLLIGLRVAEQHCNTAGYLHGGMVCAIADVALGHNIGLALARQAGVAAPAARMGAPAAPIATVSMSTDFAGSAQRGDWVEVSVDVQKVSGSLAFANAYLTVGEQRIARVSAVFRILKRS